MGGAVAALHNKKCMNHSGSRLECLEQKEQSITIGFSLGETGTLGLILYFSMFVVLFRRSMSIYRNTKDPFTSALAIGFAACIFGFSLNAFTSTLFEIRTAAFYFWLYAGFVMVLGRREK